MSGVSLKSIQEVIDSKGEYFIVNGNKDLEKVGLLDFCLEKFKGLFSCFSLEDRASQKLLKKALISLVRKEQSGADVVTKAETAARMVGIKDIKDFSSTVAGIANSTIKIVGKNSIPKETSSKESEKLTGRGSLVTSQKKSEELTHISNEPKISKVSLEEVVVKLPSEEIESPLQADAVEAPGRDASTEGLKSAEQQERTDQVESQREASKNEETISEKKEIVSEEEKNISERKENVLDENVQLPESTVKIQSDSEEDATPRVGSKDSSTDSKEAAVDKKSKGWKAAIPLVISAVSTFVFIWASCVDQMSRVGNFSRDDINNLMGRNNTQ